MSYPFTLIISALLVFAALAAASGAVQAQTKPAWLENTPEVLVRLNAWMHETKSDGELSEKERDVRIEWISLLKNRLMVNGATNLEDLVKATQDLEVEEASADRKFTTRVLPFSRQMVRVYKEVRERNEDPLALMKSYISFSSITRPGVVDDFAASRAYLNKSESMSANTARLEEIEFLDDQSLRETELAQPLLSQLATKAGTLDSPKRESDIRSDKIIPSQHSSLKL
jgi:hypothetical protein